MHWKKKDYAYPRSHSRLPEKRLQRGDQVRIEVLRPPHVTVGTFLGCRGKRPAFVKNGRLYDDQMPIFRLPTGRLIGGCECWWIRLDVARQVEAEVGLPKVVAEAVSACEAMSKMLGVRPIHVRPSGDFEALVEWKKKLFHDEVWYSLFVAPHLGVKVNPKLSRMLAKGLKVPCRRNKH